MMLFLSKLNRNIYLKTPGDMRVMNSKWGMTIFKILIFISLLFTLSTPTYAQSFGKNKVQYTYFKWQYLATEHFNIYYNQNGRLVADFAAEVAEDAYMKLVRGFRYSVPTQDPITMITYKSHNDFTQTNVTSEQPEEGVGGFTEFLKVRAVVPFEGDHEKFRHVIHHELTHVIMLKLLYGEGFGAIISGISQSNLPLWFTEGLAEYQSRGGLDRETEMFLRDAVVNDLIPEIYELDELGYLGLYKCGQSILYYIANRYGDEKIAEILHQLRGLRDFDKALKVSIGIDTEELSKRWRRWIKERYWPQVAKMDPPDRYANALTNHKREYCYINNSPSLSPDGNYIAFLSDRSDYFDVYLMRTIDGKIEKRLVHGQRTGQFEELHWLRPGISWSPDGTRIVLAAKAGKQDALYIVDVKKAKVIKQLKFKTDGIFSPAWSPRGDEIAFVMVLDGKSDIAVYNLINGELKLITDDLFDDDDPSWSLDGTRILFTSNRGGLDKVPANTLFNHPIDEFDVYEIECGSGVIRRLTFDAQIVRTPLWMPRDSTILYVSNISGAYNLYLHNLITGERRALTNIVTGAFQPSVSLKAQSLAFTVYYDNGYDIYIKHNFLNDKNLDITATDIPKAERISPAGGKNGEFFVSSSDYSHYVFDRLFVMMDSTKKKEAQDTTALTSRTRDSEGRYSSHNYKVQLTPDMFYVAASYNPYFKTQGTAVVLFSDVLGNHHIYLAADVNRSTENSNFFTAYQYLARRMDLSLGIYHYAYPFDYGLLRDRNYGIFLGSSYPLNRYNRVEFTGDYSIIERSVLVGELRNNEYREYYQSQERRSTIIPHIGYVHDTSIWHSSVEPANGGRWRVDAQFSPAVGVGDQKISFRTLSFDWRYYINYHKNYTLGIRFSGGGSEGTNPQKFFLGGLSNWFNPKYDNDEGKPLVERVEDIYFSNFVGPLRGVGYYNRAGTRYILNNLEFRFPFIRYLKFGFPIPAYFRNVRGCFFADTGIAWDPRDRNTSLEKQRATFGFGFGIRLDLGIFPLQWDVAWSPHNIDQKMVPQYYFSINTGF